MSWRFALVGATVVVLFLISPEADAQMRPQIAIPVSTSLSLASTANPSTFGVPVTLTASVTPSVAPGYVTFYAGTTILGTAELSGGQASLTTIFLPAGVNVLHAYYAGAIRISPPVRYAGSASGTVKQMVNATGSLGFNMATFPAGTFPVSVAVADFNQDGKPDLAFATSQSVTVLLGNGSGFFTTEPAISLGGPPGTDYAHFVAVGDFNNDGKADLVSANFNDNSVSVLLGNGSGGFTPATGSPIGVGNQPNSIAVADFNSDGDADLAVVNENDGTVTVLLGNGDAGFTPAAGSPFKVGTFPESIAVADFNQDGIADLAVTNFGSNNVTILLGNGSGGFTQAPGSPVPVGRSPQGIAVGDFDLDGDFDLAITNTGDNTVTILLGRGSGGFIAATSSPITVGTYPNAVAVGDFNGDGKPDLAVVNGQDGTVTILLGAGSGQFTQAEQSPFQVGSGPQAVAVADFNGDGKADLAVPNDVDDDATVLLGSANLQTITFAPIANQTYGDLTFTITATASSDLVVALASNTPAVCTIFGNTVTLVGAGTCSITATQLGNEQYATATPVTQSFVVKPAPQTITFPPLNNVILPAGPVSLSATASSGLAVTFASITPSICTVSGTTASAINTGACSIQATQPGNTDYLAATPVNQSFTVTSPFSACDINQDTHTNVTDVRLLMQEALGVSAPANPLNGNGAIDVVSVQLVINAVLQLGCEAK